MAVDQSPIEELLDRAARGDDQARHQLLADHRARLRRMVAVRLDQRLAARVDPSDIVQDALAEAARGLDEYLRERPVAFYPWLRRLAWERLVDMNRQHIQARRRSVNREEPQGLRLPDSSVQILARRLADGASSPSQRLMKREQCQQVRAALDRLDPADREILVLRHLEQLSTAEVAAALGISIGAVKMRHLRALKRLRADLHIDSRESRP